MSDDCTRATLDRDAIARAIDGDEAALEDLLRAVGPELLAQIDIQPAWRRSLDPQDIVQVSSLEAFLRIASLREPTPRAFRAWLKRIVANNLRDAIRGLERHSRPNPKHQVTRGPAGESARTLLCAVVGPTWAPSEPAIVAEQVERLRRAIEGLPRSYCTAVQLLDIEERDVAEVAAEMGRSRGAVHLLRSRGHDRLRELLEEDPD